MRKIVFLLCVIALCISSLHALPKEKRNSIYTITANTHTAVVGGGLLWGRVYYHTTNLSYSYDVKFDTWAIGPTDDGYILRTPSGWWEDKYNVYQGTWYYIIHESSAGMGTADIQIFERD